MQVDMQWSKCSPTYTSPGNKVKTQCVTITRTKLNINANAVGRTMRQWNVIGLLAGSLQQLAWELRPMDWPVIVGWLAVSWLGERAMGYGSCGSFRAISSNPFTVGDASTHYMVVTVSLQSGHQAGWNNDITNRHSLFHTLSHVRVCACACVCMSENQ